MRAIGTVGCGIDDGSRVVVQNGRLRVGGVDKAKKLNKHEKKAAENKDGMESSDMHEKKTVLQEQEMGHAASPEAKH